MRPLTGKCAGCGSDLDVADRRTVWRLLAPKGLSQEVVMEALRRAQRDEERAPLSGDDRLDARLLALQPARGRGWSEHQEVVLGRACQALGYVLVQMHPDCAEDAPRSGEYVTEGWLQ